MMSFSERRAPAPGEARHESEVYNLPGTLDHSLLATVFLQELPTAFLATTEASNLNSCN